MSLSTIVSESPTSDQLAALGDGLNEHALQQIGKDGFKPLAIFLHEGNGALVGGVSGHVNWNWLQIRLLWIDQTLRGEGYGRQLMVDFESEGLARGCTRAHVDTFSYQAREFYESLGYTIFATLDDYPPGHARHYLRKNLAS